MRILVTGASGFAGHPLVRALTARGYSVRAAARDLAAIPLEAAERRRLPDLAQPFDAAGLVEGCDAVVHLAGLAHSSSAIAEDVYAAVNARASEILARASREAGVGRFLFVSSVRAQTGPSAPQVLSEADRPAPTDAYGRSKLAAEAAVAKALAGSGTQGVFLRPVLMYGAGAKGNMATLVRLARAPWPLPLGGLKARRSILGLDNFTSAVAHALTAPACAGGTYLLADPQAVTVGEIIAGLRAGRGGAAGVVNLPLTGAGALLRALGRPALADRLFGDLVVSTAAFTATGWQPPQTTREGLAAILRG